MATTAITETPVPSPPGFSTTGEPLTWTPADTVNKNHISTTNTVTVLARNVDASVTYTVTITSAADVNTGRTGDVSAVDIVAGAQTLFQLQSNGWLDKASQTYLIEGNNANIEFAWYQR